MKIKLANLFKHTEQKTFIKKGHCPFCESKLFVVRLALENDKKIYLCNNHVIHKRFTFDDYTEIHKDIEKGLS